jgi:hypothetical protein
VQVSTGQANPQAYLKTITCDHFSEGARVLPAQPALVRELASLPVSELALVQRRASEPVLAQEQVSLQASALEQALQPVLGPGLVSPPAWGREPPV